ncbi:MAG: serine/threonine protein kinase [Acidobacteriota bacterium]
MESLLKRGQMVVARGMRSGCTILDVLGEGGQAEVYRARIGSNDYALKWYRPEYLKADRRVEERLKEAINRGTPGEQFLWPFDLVSLPGAQNCSGYVMPIKPPQFISLVDLLRRKSEPTFRVLATVAFLLADSFYRLHAAGLCYRDINFGNIFFEPETGDIRIGDTDNVDVDRRPGGIMGTWGFLAPEVGRREADPSSMTDRFSLAVLLFYIFMLGHPLKGKRELELAYDATDPDGSRRLCCDKPVFVFDPSDESNRPIPGVQDVLPNFWAIYPQSLRDLFTRSFTSGLKDPDMRVMENEWRKEMCRLRDSIFHCPQCTAENFLDLDRVRQKLAPTPCWSCQAALEMPARLRVGTKHDTHLFVLTAGAKLYGHHLNSEQYNFTTPMGEVTLNPPGVRNLSLYTWTVRAEGGWSAEAAPGNVLPLRDGARIHFGVSEGECRIPAV